LLALGGSTAYVVLAVLPRATRNHDRLADEVARFAVSPAGLLGGALVNAFVLVTVTVVATRWTLGTPVAAHLRLGRTRVRPLGVVAAIVGMAGVSLACIAATELLGVGHGGVIDVVAHALEAPSPARLVAGLGAIALAPALAEEGFFRGFIQTSLAARWGRWPAVAATAAAFGLFHVDPVQATLAFVAGLFLGWLVEHLGGLRPSIAAHAANNAIFVLLAAYGSPEGAQEPRARASAAVVLLLGATACAASVAVLRSRFGATSRSDGLQPLPPEATR
jgi:membrane protease YdiL (CAAX protease family)